jgi:hypothetical protein
MKILRYSFAAICLAAFPLSATLAQDQRGAVPADRVEILTDQDAGAVRIVIDGRDVATIDADGLHVAGNIAYTGIITDTGGQEPEGGQHED